MHPAKMAERALNARTSANEAGQVLAERFGLHEQFEALQNATHRDSQVAAMLQQEALSGLLVALADATAPKQEGEAAAPLVAKGEDQPTKPARNRKAGEK